MKIIIMLSLLFFVGCSSYDKDWDSGAQRQDAYEQQRMEEGAETFRNQNPEVYEPIRTQPY